MAEVGMVINWEFPCFNLQCLKAQNMQAKTDIVLVNLLTSIVVSTVYFTTIVFIICKGAPRNILFWVTVILMLSSLLNIIYNIYLRRVNHDCDVAQRRRD